MTPLAHGYTLGDIDAIAKSAANSALGKYASDWVDIHEASWFGVVECLYTEERPTRQALHRAGQAAVNNLAADQMHHRGYFKYKTIGRAAGMYSSPAFVQFWTNPRHGDVANAVVDRLAVYQILLLLSPGQQKVLTALAMHDDYRAAAASIGMSYATFKGQIKKARDRFFHWWHEGETPSRMWRIDKRVFRYEGTAA